MGIGMHEKLRKYFEKKLRKYFEKGIDKQYHLCYTTEVEARLH